MRVRKRGRAIGAAAAALLLASSLVPAQALAGTDRPEPAAVPANAGDVAYVARRWDGSRVVTETRTTRDPWYVRGSEGQFNGPEAGGGGWHYAGTSLRFADRVDVHGTVDLVLGDGVTLTFEDGLHVGPNDTLNVYAQSGGTGTLRALGDTNFVAAIGGNDGEDGGALTVHGGNVVADCYNDNSGEDAAGIGGGNAGSGGAVTIYGGKVEATGANYGAGIGSGDADGGGKSGGTFRMYGGEVVARGGCDGAGIGGGEGGGGADFEMWGGKVTATGGTKDANDSGAGIGSGDRDGRSIGAGAVRIHGGTVVAQGGPDAAGIGGGNEVGGGDVAIDGEPCQDSGQGFCRFFMLPS